MGEEFFVQLVLLLVEWYLNRKATLAQQKNSPIIIVNSDNIVIIDMNKD